MYVPRINSFRHHALRNMNINILDLSENMIWLDPKNPKQWAKHLLQEGQRG